jgi:hypothetical protein
MDRLSNTEMDRLPSIVKAIARGDRVRETDTKAYRRYFRKYFFLIEESWKRINPLTCLGLSFTSRHDE